MFPSRRIATSGGDVFRNEYSLLFDGTDSYVAFSTETFTGQFTVAFWINGDLATNYTNIVTNDSGANNVRVWSTNGVIRMKINNENAATITGISDDTWTHCVFTRDGDDLVVGYKNGVQTGATTTSSGDYVLTRIGHSSSSFPGKIDEVAIWDTALTSNQIKTLYNNREPFNAKNIALSNLKGYWRMGDGVLDDKQTDGLVADQVNATLSLERDDDFSSASGWNGSCTVTGGQITKDSAGLVYRTDISLSDGDVIKFTVDTDTTGSGLTAYIGGVQKSISSTGVSVIYALTSASNQYVGFNNGDGAVFNSLKIEKVNGNAGVMVNFDGTDFKTDTH